MLGRLGPRFARAWHSLSGPTPRAAAAVLLVAVGGGVLLYRQVGRGGGHHIHVQLYEPAGLFSNRWHFPCCTDTPRVYSTASRLHPAHLQPETRYLLKQTMAYRCETTPMCSPSSADFPSSPPQPLRCCGLIAIAGIPPLAHRTFASSQAGLVDSLVGKLGVISLGGDSHLTTHSCSARRSAATVCSAACTKRLLAFCAVAAWLEFQRPVPLCLLLLPTF